MDAHKGLCYESPGCLNQIAVLRFVVLWNDGPKDRRATMKACTAGRRVVSWGRPVRRRAGAFVPLPHPTHAARRHEVTRKTGTQFASLWLAATFAFVGAPAATGDVTRFKQDRFVISYWYGPMLDSYAGQRYKDMADAHFNVIHGAFNPESDKLFEVARKYDMPAIACVRGKPVKGWPSDPYCWGYHISDEPSAADFPNLRARVDEVRQHHPGKLAYINLYPNYANAKQLGTATYDEHVARFVREVNPDVLSMDHYPRFKHDRDGRDGYCSNLEVMRKYSLKAGIPFWNFFNTMPFGGHTDPTEAQIRWQIYASLTYGARGVLYFCYATPPGSVFIREGAILARDGTLTRYYDQARRINAQIAKLGPTLMQLTSTGVYRVGPDDDASRVLAGSGIKNITGRESDPPNDYLAGAFRHSDGRRAAMVMNYRLLLTAWPTVEFDVPVEQVREVDKRTGKEIPVRDDSPGMPGLQLSLDDGEGRLFILPAK